jgi:hypothetical protein
MPQNTLNAKGLTLNAGSQTGVVTAYSQYSGTAECKIRNAEC